MTDEELDRARAEEAARLVRGTCMTFSQQCQIAARLAREGWTPPDPLEAEVEFFFEEIEIPDDIEHADDCVRYRIRKALERGIELGKHSA